MDTTRPLTSQRVNEAMLRSPWQHVMNNSQSQRRAAEWGQKQAEHSYTGAALHLNWCSIIFKLVQHCVYTGPRWCAFWMCLSLNKQKHIKPRHVFTEKRPDDIFKINVLPSSFLYGFSRSVVNTLLKGFLTLRCPYYCKSGIKVFSWKTLDKTTVWWKMVVSTEKSKCISHLLWW